MSKETRMENAKNKRGMNIVLISVDGTDVKIVANENEGIRTHDDIIEYMNDTEHVGTLYPVKFKTGDGGRKSYTRQPQTEMKLTVS